jgi:glycosyltransferase involved in cell wall biosynthesis
MSRGAHTPRVTVFIPVYDRERFIGDAIRSVLAQTFTDFELLVIDDGSSDASAAVVAAFDDPRVRLVRNDRNLGIPRTRNRALELARGEYLANLDSDDLCHPERLTRQVAFLDRHHDHAVLGTWGRDMDEHGRVGRRVRREPIRWPDVHVHLLFRCALRNRSVMLRTDVARRLRYDDGFARCQDYELHARIAREHRLANLPEALVFARQHAGRFTRATWDLGRERKLDVMAAQLRELGLDPDDDDLVRHFALWRSKHLNGGLNRDYLAWAQDWLERLRAANRVRGRYVPQALDGALAGIWAKLCAEALPKLGPAALRWLPRFSAWRQAPAALAAYRGSAETRILSPAAENDGAASPTQR